MKSSFQKTIIILGLILTYQTMNSQVLIAILFGDKLNNDKLEFGLDLGLNYSQITNLTPSTGQYGFNLGLAINYKLSDRFFFSPSMYYTFPMGVRNKSIELTTNSNLDTLLTTSSVSRKLTSITIPLAFKYRLFGITYLTLGPQLSLITKATDIYTTSIFDEDDLTYVKNVTSLYQRFDMGITTGLYQKLKKDKGLSFELRYYYGFLDISKDINNPEQHNSVLYFSVVIPIGATEKEESKTKE